MQGTVWYSGGHDEHLGNDHGVRRWRDRRYHRGRRSPPPATTCCWWTATLPHVNTKTKTGIWRDLAVRKRKTEVDGQLGMLARKGEAAGVAMPHALDRATELAEELSHAADRR